MAANTSIPWAAAHCCAAVAIRSTMSSSWYGSWWNSASRLTPGGDRHGHGVLHRAVAPRALLLELARRVLGVVDQQVDAAAQLEDRLGDRRRVVGLLVVADVGDAEIVALDAVAGHRPVVRNGAGVHDVRADGELRLGAVDRDVAVELVERDREQRRADRAQQDLARMAAVELRRGVDRQAGAAAQQRLEERQALHVVPVEVAEQAGAVEQLVRSASTRRSTASPCRGRTAAAARRATAPTRTRCCRRGGRCRRSGTVSSRAHHRR